MADRLAAAGRRVIAIDLRGFGRSSPVPAGFDFCGLVDDVVLVVEAFDLDEAVVVGHSMGGAIALGLAVFHADVVAARVRGLVLVSSTARGPADTRLNRAQLRALDWELFEWLGRRPRHGVALGRFNFGAAPRRHHVEVAQTIGFGNPVGPRRGFAQRLLGTDLTAQLADVQVPVLVLTGSMDRVVAPQESIRLGELLPTSRVEILAGGGHMLPIERAGEVAEHIVRFADGLGVRPASAVATDYQPTGNV